MHPYGFGEAALANAYDDIIRLRAECYQLMIGRTFGEDKMIYDIMILRSPAKRLYLRSFDATLRRVPPIAHAKFNGICSSSLEHQLSKIGRKASTQIGYTKCEAFKDDVVATWKQMEQFRKSGAERAVDILQQLQTKYWQGTIAERFVTLDLKTTRYDKRFVFDTVNHYGGITAEQAYNLLCGRAVRRQGEDSHWLVLERPEMPDPFSSLTACHFPDFDLVKAIKDSVPAATLDEASMAQLVGKLGNGDLVKVKERVKQRDIQIQVNPGHQHIDILNAATLHHGAGARKTTQKPPMAKIIKRPGRSL